MIIVFKSSLNKHSEEFNKNVDFLNKNGHSWGADCQRPTWPSINNHTSNVWTCEPVCARVSWKNEKTPTISQCYHRIWQSSRLISKDWWWKRFDLFDGVTVYLVFKTQRKHTVVHEIVKLNANWEKWEELVETDVEKRRYVREKMSQGMFYCKKWRNKFYSTQMKTQSR